MDGMVADDREQLSRVPVVDVRRDNLTQIWPSLMLSLSTAAFVAIDIEISGLGNRKSLMAKSVEERYAEIARSAKTRSVLSLGVSCFRPSHQQDTNKVINYNVQTFDLILLCAQDYVVETASLQFLVDHGFDFNKQYSNGILYLPGNSKDSNHTEEEAKPSARLLFSQLLRSEKPLVVHNGLVDLAFLYQHFYAELPSKLATFVADLCEMFSPGLVYDTKYLAEFHLRHSSSYLEYVFRKLQLSNESAHIGVQPTVRIRFPKYGADFDCVDYRDLRTSKTTDLNKADVCHQYANHGWCPNGVKCDLSHNVSAILQMVSIVKSESHHGRRRGRKRKQQTGKQQTVNMDDKDNDKPTVPLVESGDCNQVTTENDQGLDPMEAISISKTTGSSSSNKTSTTTDVKVSDSSHRAGYDAFMTGFSLAIFLAANCSSCVVQESRPISPAALLSDESFTKRMANRICLSGKDQPLLIQRSSFAPTSKQHQIKTMVIK